MFCGIFFGLPVNEVPLQTEKETLIGYILN